jgi:succinate dehydrogenase / fumarate reductase cytochrome b subunit
MCGGILTALHNGARNAPTFERPARFFDRFEVMMSSAGTKANRPLSPHLQVYRWTATMASSILHRATGIALYGGTILLAWWLIAAASGEAYFNCANAVFGSWFGLLVLFGFTWALVHHLLGGLRHFVWDFGYGLEKPARDRLAWANIASSIIITVVLWAIGLSVW